MTVKGLARRRRHWSTFAAVWIALFAVIIISVHLLQSTAPLWMAAAVAAFPALLITDAGLALADRWGWLPKATVHGRSAHDDMDCRIPGWAVAVESLVGGGLIGWTGQPWYDHWRHVYPATPGWLLYVTIIALWGIALATGEVVIAQGFKLLHGWRGPARSNEHT
jgi:hypothetical protein